MGFFTLILTLALLLAIRKNTAIAQESQLWKASYSELSWAPGYAL